MEGLEDVPLFRIIEDDMDVAVDVDVEGRRADHALEERAYHGMDARAVGYGLRGAMEAAQNQNKAEDAVYIRDIVLGCKCCTKNGNCLLGSGASYNLEDVVVIISE
jgi:hypothetical protein